jgi:hypothetical protein
MLAYMRRKVFELNRKTLIGALMLTEAGNKDDAAVFTRC